MSKWVDLLTEEISKENRPSDRVGLTIREACQGIIDPEVFLTNLSPEDIADIESSAIPIKILRAHAEAMADRLLRERGQIPSTYTGTTICRNCGEIPIWRGAPKRVAGCPSCLSDAPPQ